MPEFDELLQPPVESTLAPALLPEELYPGVISAHPESGRNTNKKPYARLQVTLTGWPDAVPEEARFQTEPETGTQVPIDPTKRRLRKDFFLTDEAYYHLRDFLTSMDLAPQVVNGKLDMLTPINKLLGRKVWIEVRQFVPRDGTPMNVAGDIYPYRAT